MLSKGDKTRAEIVDHAKSLFYERGYDGTSFTDIVNAVGVYRGNINYYFKTKDDILKAVIDRHLEEFGALLAEWTARHADPRDRLIDFVHMIAERQAALTRYGCPIGTLNTELGKDRPELQQSARALFDLFRDWLPSSSVVSATATKPLPWHCICSDGLRVWRSSRMFIKTLSCYGMK